MSLSRELGVSLLCSNMQPYENEEAVYCYGEISNIYIFLKGIYNCAIICIKKDGRRVCREWL